MSIIDPKGLTVTEWTDYVGSDLWEFGQVPKLLDPKNWQDWGASVLGMTSISGINLPNPYNFTNWQEWAMRFNEIIDSRQF